MKTNFKLFLGVLLFGFTAIKAEDCCPEPCDSVVFSLGVDYLFWQALQDQLSFGLIDPNGFSEGIVFSNFSVLNQKFKAISGVRVRTGASFCDDWDTFFGWTHLNRCSTSHTPSVPNTILASPLFGLIDIVPGSSATSRWCLKFDTFDFEIARTWCPYQSLDFRSHLGIKIARINQNQTIIYLGIPSLITSNVEKKNHVSLIGPRFGIDAAWSICDLIDIVGGISGSLLFGKIHTHSQSFVASGDLSFSPTITNHNNRLRPTVQMMLGLSWQQDICDIVVTELGIAYEAQYWWNLLQTTSPIMYAVNPGLATGDFMTHGLTVHAGIHF